MRGFETGKSRFFRPRLIIYAVVLALLSGLFILRAGDREDYHVTVMRPQGLPFTIEQGRIRNLYTLHLQNKTDEPRVYTLAPAADALAGLDGVEWIIPQPRIALDPLGDQQLTLFVTMPRASYAGPTDFHFSLGDSISGVDQRVGVRFRGP